MVHKPGFVIEKLAPMGNELNEVGDDWLCAAHMRFMVLRQVVPVFGSAASFIQTTA